MSRLSQNLFNFCDMSKIFPKNSVQKNIIIMLYYKFKFAMIFSRKQIVPANWPCI